MLMLGCRATSASVEQLIALPWDDDCLRWCSTLITAEGAGFTGRDALRFQAISAGRHGDASKSGLVSGDQRGERNAHPFTVPQQESSSFESRVMTLSNPEGHSGPVITSGMAG
ncbi:MAG: hypothetical protein JWM59_2949 [Verrucomicrobiales bacterium]|nr:hypothetical protein [Verrucomicrobiales bacterium]